MSLYQRIHGQGAPDRARPESPERDPYCLDCVADPRHTHDRAFSRPVLSPFTRRALASDLPASDQTGRIR